MNINVKAWLRIWVCSFHVLAMWPIAFDRKAMQDYEGANGWIYAIAESGHFAVDGFLALSGYWMTKKCSYGISRRFWRLYKGMLGLALFVWLFGGNNVPNFENWLGTMLLFQNWIVPQRQWLGWLWTNSIDFQLHVVFAILRPSKRLNYAYLIIYSVVVLSVLRREFSTFSMPLRPYLSLDWLDKGMKIPDNIVDYFPLYYSAGVRGVAFAIGAIVAQMDAECYDAQKMKLAGCVALALAVLSSRFAEHGLLWLCLMRPLVGLFCALLTREDQMLEEKEYAYFFYLVHPLVISVVLETVKWSSSTTQLGDAVVIGSVGATVVGVELLFLVLKGLMIQIRIATKDSLLQ